MEDCILFSSKTAYISVFSKAPQGMSNKSLSAKYRAFY